MFMQISLLKCLPTLSYYGINENASKWFTLYLTIQGQSVMVKPPNIQASILTQVNFNMEFNTLYLSLNIL
jgi:hypothetical protein